MFEPVDIQKWTVNQRDDIYASVFSLVLKHGSPWGSSTHHFMVLNFEFCGWIDSACFIICLVKCAGCYRTIEILAKKRIKHHMHDVT